MKFKNAIFLTLALLTFTGGPVARADGLSTYVPSWDMAFPNSEHTFLSYVETEIYKIEHRLHENFGATQGRTAPGESQARLCQRLGDVVGAGEASKREITIVGSGLYAGGPAFPMESLNALSAAENQVTAYCAGPDSPAARARVDAVIGQANEAVNRILRWADDYQNWSQEADIEEPDLQDPKAVPVASQSPSSGAHPSSPAPMSAPASVVNPAR